MNTNMETNPIGKDTNTEISPIELQALLAERSAAEQAVAQKESELLIAKQNLENINKRISESKTLAPSSGVASSESETSKAEMNIDAQIQGANSIDELISVIEKTNGLQGSSEFFTPDMIKKTIIGVREGTKALDEITRTSGLRDKALELLKKERGILPEEGAKNTITPDIQGIGESFVGSTETNMISPGAEVISKENIFARGEERYNKISEKITSIKENAKTRISSAGSKLGNFFRKIKDFGYEIPKNISIAVLSTDKIVEAGLTAGADKLEKGIGFIDNMYDKAFDKIESGVVGLGNWIAEKAKATKRFTEEKAVLVASVAAYKAERTKEGLERIQDGIFNQFRRLNNFMTEAGNFASAEVNRIKMRLKDEIIAYKMRELDKEIAKDSMVAGNLEEAKQARLNAIKEKAEKLVSLRDGLSKVAVTNNSQVAI